MKWVKVADRMPAEVGRNYFVLLEIGNHFSRSVASTMYKNNRRKEIIFVGFNQDSSHYIIYNVYKWLDETEPQ